MVTSFEFNDNAFQAMENGRLCIIRRGAIYWDSMPVKPVKSPAPIEEKPETEPVLFVSQLAEQSQTSVLATQETGEEVSGSFSNTINIKSLTHDVDGVPLSYRYYDITHLTEYNYSIPIEHSSHIFRLQPVEDAVQEVVHASLELSVDGEMLRFEDVFANHSIYYDITQAYSRLMIKMNSRVKIYASPPDDHEPVMRRSQIPMVWMPWQRQMMLPYLLPPSFLKRNSGN